jgi:hypothetical protein
MVLNWSRYSTLTKNKVSKGKDVEKGGLVNKPNDIFVY